MRLITVSGPPSSGKTSVILKTIEYLKAESLKIGIVKFDCLSTYDDKLYEKAGLPVKIGLSGNLCPDHFFVSNIEDCVLWGERNVFDFLISESAGLCNRCSPHIKEVMAICVIDCLSGVNTPKKIGPMLKLADIVAITKGDIVSQAEREVFSFKVKQANPKAFITFINGITGQGAFDLGVKLKGAADIKNLDGKRLRFSMPAALCSYCLGETKIGEDYQTGNLKKMNFEDGAL
ncbi:MAG TPA: GTP-binding protein [Clostridia bacterium]